MKLFTQSLLSALLVLSISYSNEVKGQDEILVRAAAEFQNITDDVRKAKL